MEPGIEVYFTKMNMPWGNAEPGAQYWVNVHAPDGAIVLGEPAPDGRASLDLPPGRYLVTGVWVPQNVSYPNFDSNETAPTPGMTDWPA